MPNFQRFRITKFNAHKPSFESCLAKKAMKAGSNTFRLLMEKWKSDENKYRLKVYFSEMDVNYCITDNNR